MQFGLLFYPHHRISGHPHELAVAARDHVLLAEDLGYDSVWAGHHFLTDDQTLQPIPLLGYLGGLTRRIRLGAWLLVPMMNPLVLAEEIASLDALTNGRIMVGAVMGYREAEFSAAGVRKSERVERLVEGLDIMTALWQGDDVAFHGQHHRLSGATIHPKPVQRPRPPVWLGANSAAGARRAAATADGWAMSPNLRVSTLKVHAAEYESALVEQGRKLGEIARPLVRDAFIATSKRQALQGAEKWIEPLYRTYSRWGKDADMGLRGEFTGSFEALAADRLLIGDPGAMTEEIHRYQEELGTNYLIVQFNRPGMPTDLVLSAVSLFASQVIPHFR
jgi:alkanesulfonate monooxygenase SsuD/methylene tetrahydromethanopterin reductase-like flavin-dependent oxidoreductase (luciferase family)